jgi:hypothetical protein
VRGARLILVAALAALVLVAAANAPARAGTLSHPIDPRQQTDVFFDARSHWLQPWRGYLETVPATRLRDAIGINFNVDPSEAAATARLLAAHGFKRARVELHWGLMDFHDPGRFQNPGLPVAHLEALRDHGIRPLILLNSWHGVPTPTRLFDAHLLEPARAGDRSVRLDPHAVAAVVPGHTGLVLEDKAAGVLFTSVRPDGTASLSKPLPYDLEAGTQPAATLRYKPFGPPELEDGRPNPLFEETLRGWLQYVGAVTREARRILGNDRFDLEIWNELSFASDFLYDDRYYDPPRELGDTNAIPDEILRRTVAYLRDPANRLPQVPITNGFASQTPFPAPSTSPRGLTALSKHPYQAIRRFPRDVKPGDISTVLDARGRLDHRETPGPGRDPIRHDRFVPRYDAFLPEYTLTGIQTETMVRDLSPITTDVYGTRHGRRVGSRGGRPLQVWLTEANLDASGADPANPGGPAGSPLGYTPAEEERMHAKAALRYYTAFVNKGVRALYLFGVKGRNFELVRPDFFDALERSDGAYPGDHAGGEVQAAVGRLAGAVASAQPLQRTQPLSLLSISDHHDRRQFNGDGTAAHPPLYDRDVLAFLPFQLRPDEYVAAVYVMTRSLAKLYRPGPPRPDDSRFDLPAAPFRLAIGGLDARRVSASATDPLTGAEVPVRVVRRGRGELTVQMPLTDSPRLLRLSGPRVGARYPISLQVRRARASRLRTRVRFVGRVRARQRACSRRVALTVSRRSGRARRWKRARNIKLRVRRGRFAASVGRLSAGRHRARARAVGKRCAGTRSRVVVFRLR